MATILNSVQGLGNLEATLNVARDSAALELQSFMGHLELTEALAARAYEFGSRAVRRLESAGEE